MERRESLLFDTLTDNKVLGLMLRHVHDPDAFIFGSVSVMDEDWLSFESGKYKNECKEKRLHKNHSPWNENKDNPPTPEKKNSF